MTRARGTTARLFVAVELPEYVRDRLTGWARSSLGYLGSHAHVRVLDTELLHVTVCFLGSRPTTEIDSIAAELAACDGSVSELSLGAPLWLPTRRPRALAVEIHDEDGALAALRRVVVETIRGVSDWDPGENGSTGHPRARRRFHPHVTVARMPSGAAPRKRELPATPSLCFTPSELVLYRSWLSSEGARYEAIASHTIA